MLKYYNFLILESKFHLLETNFWHDSISSVALYPSETSANYQNAIT